MKIIPWMLPGSRCNVKDVTHLHYLNMLHIRKAGSGLAATNTAGIVTLTQVQRSIKSFNSKVSK